MQHKLIPAFILQLQEAKKAINSNDEKVDFESKNAVGLLIQKTHEIITGVADIKTCIPLANDARVRLIPLLKDIPYPSDQYNAIHNALLLLGRYFPYGVLKGNIIICSITLEEIKPEDPRFILASGHHFSEEGILDFFKKTPASLLRNPGYNERLTKRDQDRIELFFKQRNPDYRPHLSKKKQKIMFTGLVIGVLAASILGIVILLSTESNSIHAFFSGYGPLVLLAGGAVGYVSEFLYHSCHQSNISKLTLEQRIGNIVWDKPLQEWSSVEQKEQKKIAPLASKKCASKDDLYLLFTKKGTISPEEKSLKRRERRTRDDLFLSSLSLQENAHFRDFSLKRSSLSSGIAPALSESLTNRKMK